MAAPKILFVGHEPSRTGAPIALLTLARWLKANTDWTLGVVWSKDGDLSAEFARYLQSASPREVSDGAGKRLSVQPPFEPDLFYFNSVASIEGFRCRPMPWQRMLCHVHELEYGIRLCLGLESTQLAMAQFDRFIACAHVVGNNLVARHEVPAEKIDVIHEFVVASALESRTNRPMHRQWLRRMLKAPENAIVVGFVGTAEWRKGTDLAVQLAMRLVNELPDTPLHFVHLGAAADTLGGLQLEYETSRIGALKGRFTILSPVPDPVPYFSGMDLFALMSREDPCPLVCLEAAISGTPIAFFEGAGGIGELLPADSAFIAPYLDVEAMTKGLASLLLDQPRRDEMARNAKRRVTATNDMSVIGPQIVQTIQKTLTSPVCRRDRLP